MFIFVTLEKIILFFSRFGIDINLFSDFEISILILVSQIFVLLWYLFLFYICYKLIFKILDWWFG